MANLPRVSQTLVEVLVSEAGTLRHSQTVVEVLGIFIVPPARCGETPHEFRSGRTEYPIFFDQITFKEGA